MKRDKTSQPEGCAENETAPCSIFDNPLERRCRRIRIGGASWIPIAFAVCLVSLACSLHAATELVVFDFTNAADAKQWELTHDLAAGQSTTEGLQVAITGHDPYMFGPARDYPEGQDLWLKLRLKSDSGGTCQVFYFRDHPTEPNSLRFAVPEGRWFDARIPIGALGKGYRIRIDPPGENGSCVIARLAFETRTALATPQWLKPAKPTFARRPATVRSGEFSLRHAADAPGSFEIAAPSQALAIGHSRALIGYVAGDETRWIELARATTRVTRERRGISVASSIKDPDGGTWKIRQQFQPGSRDGTIAVTTTVSVDVDRDVVYLPVLTLFPGFETFGTNKTQAVLPGVEYLENEPSSSEADVRGLGARRLAPDYVKVTFPLMAIAARDRYVGLIWENDRRFAAVFDSPDRNFQSGAHVMGLVFPGSNGANRDEGRLLPYGPERLAAGSDLVLRATIIVGKGASVVPAVQQYVVLHGLPPLPEVEAAEFFKVAALGWLDSKIRVGERYRHAVWPGFGFGPQPAADAAYWMEWLAQRVGNADLAQRLTDAARKALAEVPPNARAAAGVGHVRYPAAPLVFGGVDESVDQVREHGRNLLRRFEGDGTVVYHKPNKEPDYASTHWSREANGLGAQVVATLLENAAFCGDKELIDAGLRHLNALLTKFKDTVPRGAQTWEIPLHTPDILASGYLVRACVLGYELSGDPTLLDHARYWAWTGVPFIYLAPPTDGPVGIYNTIPVLGATAWVAPLWIGLPVQWCGLVYADALHELAQHDGSGPWKQLADGIVAGGIQHTYPESDKEYVGLLPDSFVLRAQTRSGPAINPATVLAPAVRGTGHDSAYDVHAFRKLGVIVHAPGPITRAKENANSIEFRVKSWTPKAYSVLLVGLRKEPRVRIGGKDVAIGGPHRFSAADGRLVLQVTGEQSISVGF